MDIITPTNFRRDMFNILNKISTENASLEITLKAKNGSNDGVVLLSKREYEKMQEELHLERTGTLSYVLDAMENSTEDDFEEI